MEPIRKPTLQEENLIEHLIGKAAIIIPENWKEKMRVRQMDDGGMGSLCLYPKGEINENRKFGKMVSEFQFTDNDGVEVLVLLNIDDRGQLFELDIWKTDFSQLLSFPVIR